MANTNTRWFAAKQAQAYKALSEAYGSANNIMSSYKIIGGEIVVEGWHAWNGQGYDLIQINITRADYTIFKLSPLAAMFEKNQNEGGEK